MSVHLLTAKKTSLEINNFLSNLIVSQIAFENGLKSELRKSNGVFLTNKLKTVDSISNIIPIDDYLFNKKILEPSCGQGIFLLKLIASIYSKFPDRDILSEFIRNNIIFIDIDTNMIHKTGQNIRKLYEFLFDEEYSGTFNKYVFDFTKKLTENSDSLFRAKSFEHPLKNLLGQIDYVIGNPPYVTLYGRRDKKINEQQRIYYLNNYRQFPSYVKNGKINLVMLFLENALDFMKEGALLSFIIDISFFETAYLYTRKYLLENTEIISLDINISDFDVASGQLILKLRKKKSGPAHIVKITDRESGKIIYIKQSTWHKPSDQFRFRINHSSEAEEIINKIESIGDRTLKELYPKKNLRTCTMLLNLEDRFIFSESGLRKDLRIYPYYQGSKSLEEKYGKLKHDRYFYYDKDLQDKINEELKQELIKRGIKNKKRVGFGEIAVYDNPKVFIRQSAKQIIASYTELPSSANNSLYVFSLRNSCAESITFLKFLCGLLNSNLITFYAQRKNIIRYSKGKQPQIKISDLYSLRIPNNIILQKTIANLVDKLHPVPNTSLKRVMSEIDKLLYKHYCITEREERTLEENIKSF